MERRTAGGKRSRRPSNEVRARAARTQPLNIVDLAVAEIEESGRNPRTELGDIDDLVASINAHGLLQPIVVRPRGKHYELIAGHRRLEAMRRLGWRTAPAIIRSARSDQAFVLLLVENLQRSDLRPVEESAALEALVRERHWSTHQVAAAVGRSQAYVSKRLRVFEDPLLAPAVLENRLTVSAAEELLSVDEEIRYELLNQAIEENWDRQQVRAAARQRMAGSASSARLPGLTRRIHDLRMELRDIAPDHITNADRRELRLLVSELGSFTPAQAARRKGALAPMPAS